MTILQKTKVTPKRQTVQQARGEELQKAFKHKGIHIRETFNQEDLQRLEVLAEKIYSYFEQFKRFFVSRGTEIEAIKYAILTREHVMFSGEPGTAKSFLSKAILENIIDQEMFSQQFSIGLGEEKVFGPLLLNSMKEGIIEHNIDNSMVTCTTAFLDEFFEASKELLVSLLAVLNERQFINNTQFIDCPLNTAVITTNKTSLPKDSGLNAVLDRIAFKVEVKSIDSMEDYTTMAKRYVKYNKASFTTISYKEIVEFQELCFSRNFHISEVLFKAIYMLRTKFRAKNEHKKISDRTLNKLIDLFRVKVSLDPLKFENLEGILEVGDLRVAKYIFITGGDTRLSSTFQEVYTEVYSELEKYSDFSEKLEFLLKHMVNYADKYSDENIAALSVSDLQERLDILARGHEVFNSLDFSLKSDLAAQISSDFVEMFEKHLETIEGKLRTYVTPLLQSVESNQIQFPKEFMKVENVQKMMAQFSSDSTNNKKEEEPAEILNKVIGELDKNIEEEESKEDDDDGEDED